MKYNINNLDCASCARKIEEYLNKDKNLKNVVVNFNTSKISYESDKDIKYVNKLIKKIDPNVYISKTKEDKKEYNLFVLIIALLIALLGYFVNNYYFKNILYIISYILLLYKTFKKALKLLLNKTINENLLITISCIGAFLLGNVFEGIMVITLYTIGKILENKAINNSRKSIKNLMDIKQEFANKLVNNEIVKVNVEDIEVGDVLIVKKGERVPVDGIIIKNSSLFDASSLTGESDLVLKSVNDVVFSSLINVKEVVEIKATNKYVDSKVAKILDLLESATDKKTKMETLVNKISKFYTPIILILAILIIIVLPIFHVSILDSVYRSLTFLVISCPCAIAISVPLSYFRAIGVCSQKGILIKGSNFLDNLSEIKNIIFDKTGTLTNGSFTVSKIEIFDDLYTEESVISILTKGESLSSHVIAKSIMKLTDKVSNKDVKNYQEITGQGITFEISNKKIKIGNNLLCNCNNEALVHLNIDGKHVASIEINDGIKDNAYEVIQQLKKLNIKTYMFTGDKKSIALNISNKLKIDEVKYELLPIDKYNLLDEIEGLTAFVGDGVNDSVVLKNADIGISMGDIGNHIAISISDIVLMNDDLSLILSGISISKYTKHIVKQNLIFALTVKIVILLLSIFGLTNMWFAVFADTGVTLITILNTLRIKETV